MSNSDNNVQSTHEQSQPVHANKQFVQQTFPVFHKGLFNKATRPRSNSTGNIHGTLTHGSVELNNKQSTEQCIIQTNNYQQSEVHTVSYHSSEANSSDIVDQTKPNHVQWQRIPTINRKRIRSPEPTKSTHKQQKRNKDRQQLFNKSRPVMASTLETSNSFSLLSEDLGQEENDINIATAPSQTKRVSKPPPIILYGIEDVKQLTDFIEEKINKEEYSYKISSRDQLIISSKSVATYEKLITHIRAKGLIGHTFTKKEDRCQTFVIKNLHHTTPKEAIMEAIEATGNQVKGEIINARKKNTKEPYNVFFVNIVPNENLPHMKNIEYIYQQKVQIEDPRRNKTIAQCTRCQQYGHTKNYCMRPFRCVKCGETHSTKSCTKDRNTPATCALCEGSHPANYKGCSVYREIYAKRYPKKNINEATKPKQVQGTVTNTLNIENWVPLKQDLGQQLLNTTNEHTHSYSEVLKNNNKSQSSTNCNTTGFQNSHMIQSEQTGNQTRNEYEISLLETINKQTLKIDLLIQQMGTLMNLITALISKIK